MSAGTSEHVVQMANDIGNFFRAETDREIAVSGIANHINKFWTKRMRQKLLEYVEHGGADLDELPRAALAKIIVMRTEVGTTPTPAPSPGSTPEQHQ
jgi:formate dehydrogenase subunit delta